MSAVYRPAIPTERLSRVRGLALRPQRMPCIIGGMAVRRARVTHLVMAVLLAGASLPFGGANASAVETPVDDAAQQLASRLAEMDEMLAMPLGAFLERKSEAADLSGPTVYDWSSDGCTTFVSTIPEAAQRWLDTFEPACERHDWGYRNFGSINRRGYDATEERRREVDEQLRTDLRSICDGLDTESITCRVVAEAIYRAVRAGGQLSFYGFFESPHDDAGAIAGDAPNAPSATPGPPDETGPTEESSE